MTNESEVISVKQMRALLKLLYPDHMTPNAKRMFEAVFEAGDTGPLSLTEEQASRRIAELFQHHRKNPKVDPYEFAAYALDELRWPRADGSVPADTPASPPAHVVKGLFRAAESLEQRDGGKVWDDEARRALEWMRENVAPHAGNLP